MRAKLASQTPEHEVVSEEKYSHWPACTLCPVFVVKKERKKGKEKKRKNLVERDQLLKTSRATDSGNVEGFSPFASSAIFNKL